MTEKYLTNYFNMLETYSPLAVIDGVFIKDQADSCELDTERNHVFALGNRGKSKTYIIDSMTYGMSTISLQILSNNNDKLFKIIVTDVSIDTLNHAKLLHDAVCCRKPDSDLTIDELTDDIFREFSLQFGGSIESVYDELDSYEVSKPKFYIELERDMDSYNDLVILYRKFEKEFLDSVKDDKIREMSAKIAELQSALDLAQKIINEQGERLNPEHTESDGDSNDDDE